MDKYSVVYSTSDRKRNGVGTEGEDIEEGLGECHYNDSDSREDTLYRYSIKHR